MPEALPPTPAGPRPLPTFAGVSVLHPACQRSLYSSTLSQLALSASLASLPPSVDGSMLGPPGHGPGVQVRVSVDECVAGLVGGSCSGCVVGLLEANPRSGQEGQACKH